MNSKKDIIIKEINNAIPKLRELSEGSLIRYPHWNVFSNVHDGFDIYTVFKGKVYNDDNESICELYDLGKKLNTDFIEVFTNPKLNHVIKWLYTFNSVSVIFESNKFFINHGGELFETKLAEWNLDEELLEYQWDDLIDFLYQFI
jgi:hypothetical protein